MHTIGIDVGGTKVLGVVVDDATPGAVLAEERVPTPDGGEGLVDEILSLVDSLAVAAGPPDAIGVGLPGLVDRTGRLRVGAHLRRIQNLSLAELLAERSGLPVVVDNDANCHAVAERAAGAAQGYDDALVVTLGTGIGAGIIIEGRLLRGANGFAGEPGHMIVVPDGPPCPCGQRGCWERFGSGSGLGRIARDAAAGGRLDAVVELAGGDPEDVRGEHVTAAARQGDAEAQVVLDELAGWIALGLANLVNLLDPGVIVIGGGLVDAADLILPEVRRSFRATVMAADHRPEPPIVAATLGGRAGAIGAGVLAASLG
jgi:glucokinase